MMATLSRKFTTARGSAEVASISNPLRLALKSDDAWSQGSDGCPRAQRECHQHPRQGVHVGLK